MRKGIGNDIQIKPLFVTDWETLLVSIRRISDPYRDKKERLCPDINRGNECQLSNDRCMKSGSFPSSLYDSKRDQNKVDKSLGPLSQSQVPYQCCRSDWGWGRRLRRYSIGVVRGVKWPMWTGVIFRCRDRRVVSVDTDNLGHTRDDTRGQWVTVTTLILRRGVPDRPTHCPVSTQGVSRNG